MSDSTQSIRHKRVVLHLGLSVGCHQRVLVAVDVIVRQDIRVFVFRACAGWIRVTEGAVCIWRINVDCAPVGDGAVPVLLLAHLMDHELVCPLEISLPQV